MQIPHIENRWTTGNLMAAVAACLTLITVLGGAITNSNTVPQVAHNTATNTTDIARLSATLADQQAEQAQTRQEVLSRLDRIEAKLDTKVDKDATARGWTRP